MAEKNTLDNLAGQEIKEMINRNIITLEQLDAPTLRILMDYETDMLCIGEGDADLICKCSDLLDAADPAPITSEEFMNIIEQCKKEQITIVDKDEKHNGGTKMRFILKRTALIAAVVAVLTASTVAVAGAFGFDICKYISEIVREPQGSKSNNEGFTFYHDGEVKKYSSVSEMIRNENLDIMYPTILPQGIHLVSAFISVNENGNKRIIISTNDTDTNIEIEISALPFTNNSKNIIECNGIKYYIGQSDCYFAYCYYNNNAYQFTATTEEGLITIIENMKE